MNNNLEKDGSNDPKANVKEKVLRSIKEKGIKIRSPFVILAEKLGLESALAAFVIFGALLVSIFFYFLKKTGVIKFLSLGMPGVKVFLLSLPYDYIALFIITLILAIYIAQKISFFCGDCSGYDRLASYLFFGTLIIGMIFAGIGVGDFIKGWSKKKIPHEFAIHGRIYDFSGNEVIIEEDGDGLVTIYFEDNRGNLENREIMLGKYLRATGMRDLEDHNIFHAYRIRCCDDD